MRKPILLLSLLLIGCSALSTLDQLLNDSTQAVTILQAAGVDVPPLAVAFVDAADTCVANQQGSTAPPDQQILAMTSCLAAVIQSQHALPAGTPSAILAIVQAVATDIQNWLASHQTASVALAAPAKQRKLSSADVVRFKDLTEGFAKLHTQLKALPHK